MKMNSGTIDLYITNPIHKKTVVAAGIMRRAFLTSLKHRKAIKEIIDRDYSAYGIEGDKAEYEILDFNTMEKAPMDIRFFESDEYRPSLSAFNEK